MASSALQGEELCRLSIGSLLKHLRKREFTCVDVANACMTQQQRLVPMNAFISPSSHPRVIDLASAADARYNADPSSVRILEGVPVCIKDNFCMQGIPSTAASRMLAKFVPPYSATVVDRLLNGAGGISLGKTNMDEYGMGSGNTNSHFGPCINPYTLRESPENRRVAGGSSGGTAAAVAAHICYGGLGSDTGGSVRLPSAFCGTVGLKPSYGRASRWGLIAFASSLDTPGVIARDVSDAALLLEAIAGHDTNDSTSRAVATPKYSSFESNVKGKTVGVPKEYMVTELGTEIRELWVNSINAMKDAGAKIKYISLPHTKYALAAYYILAPAEASSNLARYDGIKFGHRTTSPITSIEDLYSASRTEGFGEEVRQRILLGTFTLSRTLYDSYYKKAQQIRHLVYNDFESVFNDKEDPVDVILHPTSHSVAFPLARPPATPVHMYINDVMTIPASMAGLPAISVPLAMSQGTDSTDKSTKGLPLAMQLVGRDMDEMGVLGAASVLSSAFSFPAWQSQ